MRARGGNVIRRHVWSLVLVDSLLDPEYNAHVIDIEKQIDYWRTSSFD